MRLPGATVLVGIHRSQSRQEGQPPPKSRRAPSYRRVREPRPRRARVASNLPTRHGALRRHQGTRAPRPRGIPSPRQGILRRQGPGHPLPPRPWKPRRRRRHPRSARVGQATPQHRQGRRVAKCGRLLGRRLPRGSLRGGMATRAAARAAGEAAPRARRGVVAAGSKRKRPHRVEQRQRQRREQPPRRAGSGRGGR